MSKEIVLPPHLYDRIKASAGEHGGVGRDRFFSQDGVPTCVHGLAWGTEERMRRWVRQNKPNHCGGSFVEPELYQYIQWYENDEAVITGGGGYGQRIPFETWCEILNVKRGAEASSIEAEKELAGAAS